VPLPLLVPADSVASLGTPLIAIEMLSSASCGVTTIGSAAVWSSVTVTEVAVPARLGGSEAGLIVSAMSCVVDAPGPSELVAVTVSVAVDPATGSAT
jgi:4-hydroxy-3-methylbut-2-en-1-yl diphosphate synthase IspG/GcpE